MFSEERHTRLSRLSTLLLMKAHDVVYGCLNFSTFFCCRTASFRVLSLVYAKLLVVVCIAFLISEIVTTNVPLHYYEVSANGHWRPYLGHRTLYGGIPKPNIHAKILVPLG